jgi:hypothetical protein
VDAPIYRKSLLVEGEREERMFATINWSPNRKAIRSFGGTLLVAFILLGGILAGVGYLKTGRTSWIMLQILSCLGVGIYLSCFLLERSLGLWIYKAWMGLAFVLSKVMSPVIVSVFYFLILTPIGLVLHLTKRDPMQKKRDKRVTFWYPVKHKTTPKSYIRQF